VAGNAARLVNTESVSELADAMAELCSRTELRLQLREQGLARSRMFTWERTASQTLDIFHRVAEAGAT
jgi:alpha-1,3-rhamnosyl/mannosyltransferase